MLDICTHFEPTETFQYSRVSTCHPSGVKGHFIKGEALRLQYMYSELTLLKHYLKRASQTSKHIFLREDSLRTLSKQPSQKLLLKTEIKPLPFVTQYHPAMPNVKPILMNSLHFITQQPLLNKISTNRP